MKTFLLALVGAIAISGAASMQEPPKSHEHGEQTLPPAAATTMPMMQMKAMAAQDKKLDELAAELNAAKGNDRIDKLVAVVNELVAERKDMRG